MLRVEANRRKALDFLDGLGMAYALHSHAPAYTAEDCGRIEGIDWRTTEIARNALLAPTSLLRSAAFSGKGEAAATPEQARQAYITAHPELRFTLMLLRRSVPFRTAEVSRAMGVSRLSFAPEDVLPALLGVYAGAVSPLGLLFDTQKRVRLAMDEGLRTYAHIGMHPCDNTATVVMRVQDFTDVFLPALGVQPTWVALREGEEQGGGML